MITKVFRLAPLAAVAALALFPAWAGGQTASNLAEVYTRMQKVNASLKSFQADLHVDVRMRSFPPINPSLDGTAYYKQPDKNAVIFNTVPVLANAFKRVYPQ